MATDDTLAQTVGQVIEIARALAPLVASCAALIASLRAHRHATAAQKTAADASAQAREATQVTFALRAAGGAAPPPAKEVQP